MSSYSQYQSQSGSGSKRTVVLIAILGLHAFIGWAFISGFVNKIANNIAKDVQVSLIKDQQAKDTPPPPPKPRLDLPPPVSVPTPIVNINIPLEAPPIITTNRPPPPAPPPPRAVAVAATPVTTVRLPECNEDYYPAQAKRLEQEGSVTVKVCVNAANKIEGPIEVVTSSGFPLLDEAAGKCISQGRYKAGTIEGKPATTCKQLKLTYKLKGAS
jgi:protein TonB